jgi:hypothetical protein
MRKMCFLLLFLGACSIEKRGAPGTDPTIELNVAGESGDSVEVTISTPRYAALGDQVPISVVVRNNRQRRIELHLTGRDITFNIVVARTADSTIVWERLRNVAVQQILQLKSLAPGESFTLSDRWRATEAGEFVIGAELPTDTKGLEAAPVRLVVR